MLYHVNTWAGLNYTNIRHAVYYWLMTLKFRQPTLSESRSRLPLNKYPGTLRHITKVRVTELIWVSYSILQPFSRGQTAFYVFLFCYYKEKRKMAL